MSDVENAAPSNGAGETTAVVETVTTPVEAPKAEPVKVDTAPAKSAKEAVQRAMAKVNAPKESNNATTENRPEVKPDATGKLHGPDGKFVAKEGAKEPASDPIAEPPKPKRPVPSRFAKEAHPHWETAHEALQTEVERALTELTSGIDKHKGEAEKYRTGHESWEALRQYDEMARKSGTTLANALGSYTGIENLLKQNFAGGVLQLCQNFGVHPQQLMQAIANGAQLPQQPQQQAQPWQQEITALRQTVEELRMQPVQAEVERFKSDPSRSLYKYLEPAMMDILQKGEVAGATPSERLAAAYDAALSASPELKSLLDAKAAADAAAAKAKDEPKRPDPAQTREKAALSVTGSPLNGSNPSKKPAGSAREAIRKAVAQVGL